MNIYVMVCVMNIYAFVCVQSWYIHLNSVHYPTGSAKQKWYIQCTLKKPINMCNIPQSYCLFMLP